MTMTLHANHRAQQRAIPPLIIDWLDEYGARAHSANGTTICYFNKKSRRSLERAVGRGIVDRLSSLLDAYMVVDGESVITVGHRYKPIKHK